MTDTATHIDTERPAGTDPARVFEVFTEIGIINQLSTALLASSLPDGLHPSHFAILNHLTRRGDGKTPIRIAQAMQVAKHTMTHSLRVLEGRGLIDVRPNPGDGRGKLVFLTPEGERFRADAIAEVTRRFDAIVTPELLELLDGLRPGLVEVRKHLDENRA